MHLSVSISVDFGYYCGIKNCYILFVKIKQINYGVGI